MVQETQKLLPFQLAYDKQTQTYPPKKYKYIFLEKLIFYCRKILIIITTIIIIKM